MPRDGSQTRARLLDPIGAVGRIAPKALLLIAPKEDRLISWRQSVALFEAAGEPKELFVVEGAGHAEAIVTDPESYRRRVLDFLDRHLVETGEPAPAPVAPGGTKGG